MTTQPEFSFWFVDVGWGVENYGTDPDVDVDIAPQEYAASHNRIQRDFCPNSIGKAAIGKSQVIPSGL